MAKTTREIFARLSAPKAQGGLPTPVAAMSRNQIIDSGREVIRSGVDPEIIVHSNQVPNDMKYAVARAHSEDLRDAADKADRLARRKPTQANRDNSELAFADYANWNKDNLEPLRTVTRSEFPDMEEETFDPRTYTDLREEMFRVNGRDFKLTEKAKAEQSVRAIDKTIADRNAILGEYDRELEHLSPELRENIKDGNDLYRFVANVLKDKFPCSM